MSADKLKRKLKSLQPSIPEAHAVRMHRAISWLKAAESQSNDPDLALISLWICWNSCYAVDKEFENVLTERKQFKEFTEKLVALDKEERLSKLFWTKYSGAIRVFYKLVGFGENSLIIKASSQPSKAWPYKRGKILFPAGLDFLLPHRA